MHVDNPFSPIVPQIWISGNSGFWNFKLPVDHFKNYRAIRS